MNVDQDPLPHYLRSRTSASAALRLRLEQFKPFLQAGLVVLLLLAVFMPLIRLGYLKDLEGLESTKTPKRTGTAVVLSKYTRGSSMNISFRINGQNIKSSTTDETKWTQTNVGDTLPVSYRIGTRGSYFIFDWQPLPRKADLPH